MILREPQQAFGRDTPSGERLAASNAERHAHADRYLHRSRQCVERELGLFGIDQGFEQQRLSARCLERQRLLAVHSASSSSVDRRRPHPETDGADRADHVCACAGALAAEPHGGLIDQRRFTLEPVGGERDRIRLEGMSTDELRSRVHVLANESRHELGSREVRAFEASCLEPALPELGAECPVNHDPP